jgi:hypothetical protein
MPDTRQNSTPFDGLAPLQAQVAAALASGATVSAVAAQTDVHRSTIHNWLKEPAFRQAVDQARKDYAESLRAQLAELSGLALDTIRQVLTDPKTPASVRLRAAMAVLERPQYPDRGWSLPVPAAYYPETQQRIVEELAVVDAGEASFRASITAAKAAAEPALEAAVPDPPPSIPRNSRCPCGSGQKYKRCCARLERPSATPPRLAAAIAA